VMKPGYTISNPILRVKIRFKFHLRACCMQYSLIPKVQSFKFQSQKVVLSLESFAQKVFFLNLLISIRNADCAPVSAASNYSMVTHQPINPLRYRNIWKNQGSMSYIIPHTDLTCPPVTYGCSHD
jgi:hypothetical protein